MRRSGKPVVVVANKAEARGAGAGMLEAWELGLGEPVPISAEHGQGLPDLREAIIAALGEERVFADEDEEADAAVTDALIGEDIADPDAEEPAYDADEADAHRRGRPPECRQVDADQCADRRGAAADRPGSRHHRAIPSRSTGIGAAARIKLFDTAGMRRKAKVQEKLEKLSVADGLRAIRFAEVVIIVLDATIPFEKQDLQIADLIVREGRAPVIAFNKWDLIEDRQRDAGRAAREDRAAAAAGEGHPGRAGLGRDRPRPRQADGCGDRAPTRSGTAAFRPASSTAGSRAFWRTIRRRPSPAAGSRSNM